MANCISLKQIVQVRFFTLFRIVALHAFIDLIFLHFLSVTSEQLFDAKCRREAWANSASLSARMRTVFRHLMSSQKAKCSLCVDSARPVALRDCFQESRATGGEERRPDVSALRGKENCPPDARRRATANRRTSRRIVFTLRVGLTASYSPGRLCDRMLKKFLITGRPGAGKITLIK